MTFTQLKVYRIANELTQEQVANILGITRSAYCGYEIGRRTPDVEILSILSRFYGVPIENLISCSETVMEDNYNAEEPRYLIQLTNEEKDLIINFRTSNEEKKQSIIEFASEKE